MSEKTSMKICKKVRFAILPKTFMQQCDGKDIIKNITMKFSKKARHLTGKETLFNYIFKVCGRPEEFAFEYIFGESDRTGIRRMQEYLRCVKQAKKAFNKRER